MYLGILSAAIVLSLRGGKSYETVLGEIKVHGCYRIVDGKKIRNRDMYVLSQWIQEKKERDRSLLQLMIKKYLYLN